MQVKSVSFKCERTSGQTIYWSKPRYDELNRVVETYAPAIEGQTGASLGITEFGISIVPDYVGTYTTATDASGRRARSITNALGQLVRIDEPTGTNDLGTIDAPNQPTFYKYNPQGKMVKVSQGQQNRYFLYDYLGRLIRVKQPEQEVNSLLNTTQTVDGNYEWTAKMEYDLIGNLIKTTDAENKQITNTYDKASRVTKREYSNLDTPTVFYYYDGTGLGAVPSYSKGKLTKVSSTISASLFTSFDNFGRVLTHQQITDNQTYNTSYKYSLSGALTDETYPSGKVVRNFFESDGDLAKVVRNGKTYVSDFNYNASGGVKSLKLGNGRFETAQFNSRQQMTQIGLGSDLTANDLWKVEYKYGELAANGIDVDITKNTGNIAKQIITLPNVAFTQTYKYDALERLTEAKEISTNNQTTWQQAWNYDRFGNRLSFNSQGIGLATINTTPVVNPETNRFISTQDFGYDKTGNVVKDKVNGNVRNFVFNGDNKQVHVKDANNVAIGTYYYDGNGARVKKTVGGNTTVFVYDAKGVLIAEYSTETPTTNPNVSYTTTDHLGSPRVITDKTGNVTSRRDFMPFGEELNANNATNRLDTQKYTYGEDNVRKRFTGYEKDQETGLDFAEARYYNNAYGRFTAVDPLLASGKNADPQTFNRYVYVGDNPVTRVDKNGQDWYVYYDTHVRQNYSSFNGGTVYWSSRNLAGVSRWTGGAVFQNTWGKHTGRWNALDPYSGRTKSFKTREAAERQYATYLQERNVNVARGVLDAFAHLATVGNPIGNFIYEAGANAVIGRPDPNSDVYTVMNRATNAMITITMTVAGPVLEGVMAENVIVTAETELATTTESGILTTSLEERAKEIHSILDPIAQSKRTTAIVETAEGQNLVSSSAQSLTPAQRAALGPNEIAVSGQGHAEVTGLNAAKNMNLTPTNVAASRRICTNCAGEIVDAELFQQVH